MAYFLAARLAEETLPGRPMRRAMMAGILAMCCFILAGCEMFQNKLLYFPLAARVSEMTLDDLAAWPTADDFRGLLAEADRPALATAIVFHGNAGHAGHRRFYVDALRRHGLRVILAEYPGYGPRGGELGEQSLVADAEQTIALARSRFAGPLLIVGESLGAGIAAAAGKRREAIAGLLLITPWDKLENIARHHYPLLPVKWLLRDHYDSVGHLRDFGRPVLVAVAVDDAIIPPDFGKALHATLGAPKRLSVIERAGHNDWFDRLDERWWRQALAFLLGDRPQS